MSHAAAYALPPSEREQSLRRELCDKRTEMVGLLAYLSAPSYTRAVRLLIDIETMGGDLRVEVYKSHLREVDEIARRATGPVLVPRPPGFDANGSPVPACENCGNHGEPMGCPRCGIAGGA